MQGITVTLVTVVKSGIDDYGNDVFSCTSADIDGCVFVPQQTSESVQGSDQTLASAKVYVPADLATADSITFADQVIVAGRKYEVDGQPKTWTSPFTGITPWTELDLREVTGASAHVGAGAGG